MRLSEVRERFGGIPPSAHSGREAGELLRWLAERLEVEQRPLLETTGLLRDLARYYESQVSR